MQHPLNNNISMHGPIGGYELESYEIIIIIIIIIIISNIVY